MPNPSDTRPRRIGAYFFCSPAIVRAALQRQGLSLKRPKRERRLGEVLVEMGAVTPAEVDTAVRTQRVARLRACPLFADLTRTELAALAARFTEVSVAAGEQFIRQGEEDPTLYVVASGRLEVFRVEPDGREVPLAVVGAGEPIGEMGYFAGGVRNASVRALEATELLRARYTDLTHYFENVPRVAHAFIDVVERRRAATQARLAARAHAPEAAPAPLAHLAAIVDLSGARHLGSGMEGSIKRLVHAAARVTDAERASLFLVDGETGELWSMVAEALETGEARLQPGEGIAGWVAAHGEIANVTEAYEDPRFSPAIDRLTGYRTRTVLAAPVRDERQRVVGVVQVLNKNFGAFTDEDERLLRAFCEQVGAAVANLETYRRLVEDYEVLTGVLEIATLASMSRDLGTLSDRVGTRLEELLECRRCDLLIADYGNDRLWSARRDGAKSSTSRFAVTELPAGRAAVEGCTINIADASADAEIDPGLHERLGVAVTNLLAVPVRNSARTVVGVLQCVNRDAGPFTRAEERLAEAVAAQIGVSALVNA